MTSKSIATLFVALMCSAPYGQAQEATPLPPPHTENGITYVCGGVGSDEAAQMKQAASKYDLMLTFATKRGDYLSDVKVEIADARGHALLTTVCDGPIMLVDMPKQGRYVVRGEMAGHAVSGTALLGPGARGKPLHLVLPGAGDTSGQRPAAIFSMILTIDIGLPQ